MNADRDRSEQPCTDTRCDAPTHPLDTEGAHLPPITEPIALGDPATDEECPWCRLGYPNWHESDAQRRAHATNAPEPHTDPTETREDAREAHSDDERVGKYRAALQSDHCGCGACEIQLAAVMAVADAEAADLRAEVERLRLAKGPALFEEMMSAVLARAETAERALAVGRARVARVEAALANHPKVCDKHPRSDSCGWKSAVRDVQAALAEPDPHVHLGPVCECGAKVPTR